MDLRSLREDRLQENSRRQRLQEERRHGHPDLPVGLYRMAPGPGDPVLETHWHAEYEFLIMERGQALFQIGLTTYEAQAGDVLFIPGGELHGGYWPETGAAACAYSAIVFDLDWLAGRSGQDRASAQWLLPLQRGEVSLPHHLPADHPAAAAIYREAAAIAGADSAGSPGFPLRLTGGLLALFAEYADAGLAVRQDPWNAARPETPERLIRVLAYMEQEYGRKLTVAQLAGIAGMSEGHFSRLFKLYMRKTPIEYLNGYRLQRAAEQLRRRGVTVSEAALSCGFDNFSYFSKMFRSRFHCTPSEYRR